MTDILKQIRQPVSAELKEFDEYFNSILKSKLFLLDKVLQYIVRRKGKQMRPIFVMLSAGMNGTINEKTYRTASLIELLHTASLVHDDVVDDSSERRGAFSVNALWKNKIAVLAGDFLLARGMLLALNNKDYDMLEITSEAVRLMSEGELLQIQKARTLDIREDIYYEVIRMKTASLFATSCAAGASSAGADDPSVKKMWDFGENCGMAFQIKDDLMDFKPEKSGKPKGVDVKEKKMTLPLIYALSQAERSEKRKIINRIAHPGKKKDVFNEIIRFIDDKKGFDYASSKMDFYRDNALRAIDSYPQSPFKASMISLVSYLIDRNK